MNLLLVKLKELSHRHFSFERSRWQWDLSKIIGNELSSEWSFLWERVTKK